MVSGKLIMNESVAGVYWLSDKAFLFPTTSGQKTKSKVTIIYRTLKLTKTKKKQHHIIKYYER